MYKSIVLLLVALVALASADLYMHFPRGSNNKVDEAGNAPANRLFNSQNNNRGGYNSGEESHGMREMFYEGSNMMMQWTSQHGCGANPNVNCQHIVQYRCDDQMRNGIERDSPQDNNDPVGFQPTADRGLHEPYSSWYACKRRQANQGLFHADQGVGNQARHTRQNPNGNRSGYECAEERDYYPYWHPSDWKDIAVLTSNMSQCELYQTQSQNVMSKNYCTQVDYNNQADCTANGGLWETQDSWDLDPPLCQYASTSRGNVLSSAGYNGEETLFEMAYLNITIPEEVSSACVIRVRYNISTNDYDPWNTFADQNGANSPIEDNPQVDVGNGVTLALALNTDQYFRTFEDRSSTFTIKPRPDDIAPTANIYNLNVRGQRGNIVQNFPSVEYDFAPTTLVCTTDDYVHRQVTGSNTTPAGAGQGREQTDRSNFVELADGRKNYPQKLDKVTFVQDPTGEGFNDVERYATLNQGDNEQDQAAPHQDFGLQNYEKAGHYKYMSSRNNNFTNRSQKGYITVIDSKRGLSNLAAILIAVGAALVVVGAGVGTVVYGVRNPDSRVGQGVTAVTSKCSGGGASMPTGYSGPAGL